MLACKDAFQDAMDTLQEEAKPRQLKPQDYTYDTVNVYEEIPVDTVQETKRVLFTTNKSLGHRISRILQMNETWFFLMILGFSCALVGVACDTAMRWLVDKRREWSSYPEVGFIGNYVIWTVLGVFFTCISAFCVAEINPHCAGSGMPALKSVLSGLILPHYLSVRCLVAKTLGVIGTIAASLACGKEGPYVHICGMLAYQLTRVPLFRRMRKNKGLKIQMVGAGCAAGFGVTFGAPIGGVLYSIETTSTYYLVQNLFKAFFCAVCATLLMKLLGSEGLLPLSSTNFNAETPYAPVELIFFSLGGIVYGLAGALFVYYVHKVTIWRKRYKILQRPYVQAILIGAITSVCSFPLEPLRHGQSSIIDGFFVTGDMMEWQSPNVLFNLALFTVVTFILCGYTICIPVVSGLFTPVLILGASSGRLWGELMRLALPNLNIIPGGYAVVGSAAFSAGATRTVAAGIIVFELTGQMTHLIPVLLAVLIAAPIGNFFTASVYDTLLKEKGLPYIPAIRNSMVMKKKVEAIMSKNIDLIPTTITYNDLYHLLSNTNKNVFPIVDNTRSMSLLGQISRNTLEHKLYSHEKTFWSLTSGAEEDRTDSQAAKFTLSKEKVVSLFLKPGELTHTPAEKKSGKYRRRISTEAERRLRIQLEQERVKQEQLALRVRQLEEQMKGGGGGGVSPDIATVVPTVVIEPPTTDVPEKKKKHKKGKEHVITREEFFSRLVGFEKLVSPSMVGETQGDLNPEEEALEGVDLSPFTIVESAPMSKVHFLFAVLGLSLLWVVRQGKLVGVITKEDLMNMDKED